MNKITKIITAAAVTLIAAVCISPKASADAVFDAESGTLTLSGNVEMTTDNSNIVLPSGVSKSSVISIKCDKNNKAVFPSNCRNAFLGFSNCTSIDLIYSDTSGVTNMYSMFDGCSKVTVLDLTTFDMSNVTNVAQMFRNCSSLKTIYVSSAASDWTKIKTANSIFTNCNAIKGGSNTTYKGAGKEYAKVDGGESDPGYFTLKAAPVSTVTITFESNGGTEIAPITVDSGSAITLPDAPARDDDTFGGWYTDKKFTSAFDPSAAITSDITLYAKWTMTMPASYTAKYRWDGDTCYMTLCSVDGAVIAKDIEMTKSGDTYTGKYDGKTYTTSRPALNAMIISNTRVMNGDGETDKVSVKFSVGLSSAEKIYITDIGVKFRLDEGNEHDEYVKSTKTYSSNYTLTLQIPNSKTITYWYWYKTSDGAEHVGAENLLGVLEE